MELRSLVCLRSNIISREAIELSSGSLVYRITYTTIHLQRCTDFWVNAACRSLRQVRVQTVPPTMLEIIMVRTHALKGATRVNEWMKGRNPRRCAARYEARSVTHSWLVIAIEEKCIGRVHLVRVHTYGKWIEKMRSLTPGHSILRREDGVGSIAQLTSRCMG